MKGLAAERWKRSPDSLTANCHTRYTAHTQQHITQSGFSLHCSFANVVMMQRKSRVIKHDSNSETMTSLEWINISQRCCVHHHFRAAAADTEELYAALDSYCTFCMVILHPKTSIKLTCPYGA